MCAQAARSPIPARLVPQDHLSMKPAVSAQGHLVKENCVTHLEHDAVSTIRSALRQLCPRAAVPQAPVHSLTVLSTLVYAARWRSFENYSSNSAQHDTCNLIATRK